MLAWDAADTAVAISAVALVVSLIAAIYTRQESQAVKHANAPEVTAEAKRNGQGQEYGLLTLTVSTRHAIKSLTVGVLPGSAVDRLGLPKSNETDRQTVVLADVAGGTPIELPVHWQATGDATRLRVTITGPAFARTSIVLEPPDSTPWVGMIY